MAPMDSFRDYSSIIHSPSFTFLVGPKHTKLTIQSGLAYHVSKPLHNLMNNGHTRESIHRIAVLEDEDVDTFVAFCEYAYTGDYNVHLLPAAMEDYRVAGSAPIAGKSWRETMRSHSISSTVGPKAPSPPPQSDEAACRADKTPETAPTSVFVGDASAEAEAEANEDNAEDAQEANAPNDVTADNEATDLANQADATVPEEAGEQLDPNPTVKSEEWAQFPTQASTAKKPKKKERKKKKRQEPEWPDEPAANLTPPTTPPPRHPVDADEVRHDNALEETIEPEAVSEPEAAEQQATEERLADPETTLEHASGECEQRSTFLITEDMQHQEPWTDDGADGQNAASEDLERPKPIIDMSFAKQTDSSPRTPGLSLWDEFTALQYHDDQHIAQATPIRSDIPYLTFHAKVYVFATRYLIPALAQLCLRKLHRDLLQLSFADSNPLDPCPADTEQLRALAARQVPMVLNLLRCAYTKTTRLEPISLTSATQLRENELRRLVVHYAACKVKELARYHSPGDSETATPSIRPVDAKVERTDDAAPKSLRSLLDMTPELASDLVYRMM